MQRDGSRAGVRGVRIVEWEEEAGTFLLAVAGVPVELRGRSDLE